MRVEVNEAPLAMFNRIRNAHPRIAREQGTLRRKRQGFTLIELVITLMLLDVGLLALVGTSAAIARGARTTRAAVRAWSIASARLERSASMPCQADQSGTAVWVSGVTEWWTATPAANGTRTITDSTTFSTAHGTRSAVLRMGARC